MNLMWGQISDADIPADEQAVRGNSPPVDHSAPPSEAQGAPEWNEPETDPDPQLGMATRQVASDWHERERFVPSWIPVTDANVDHNAIVDRQVATSGTAAAREAQGEWGHGSMEYAVGIEPVIRDGGAFGNDYFAIAEPGIQQSASTVNGVQPSTQQDRDDIASVSQYGRDSMHDAFTSGQANDWYAAMLNGGNA